MVYGIYHLLCNVEGHTMEISKSVGIKNEQQEHLVAKSAVINKLISLPSRGPILTGESFLSIH